MKKWWNPREAGGVTRVSSVSPHTVDQRSSFHWLGSLTPGSAKPTVRGPTLPRPGSLRPPPNPTLHLKLRPSSGHACNTIAPITTVAKGASWRPLPARLALVHWRRAQSADVPRSTKAPSLLLAYPRGGLTRSSPTTVVPPCAHRRASVRTARDTQATRAQSPKAALGLGTTPAFFSVLCFSWAAPPLTPPPLAWPVSISTLFPAQG